MTKFFLINLFKILPDLISPQPEPIQEAPPYNMVVWLVIGGVVILAIVCVILLVSLKKKKERK